MTNSQMDEEKLAKETAAKLESNTRIYLAGLVSELASCAPKKDRETINEIANTLKRDSSVNAPGEMEAVVDYLVTQLIKIRSERLFRLSKETRANKILFDKLDNTIELQKILLGMPVRLGIESQYGTEQYDDPEKKIRVCAIKIEEYKAQVDAARPWSGEGFAQRRNQVSDNFQNFLRTMLFCIPNKLRSKFTESVYKRTEGSKMIDRSADLINEYKIQSREPATIYSFAVTDLKRENTIFLNSLKNKMLKQIQEEIDDPLTPESFPAKTLKNNLEEEFRKKPLDEKNIKEIISQINKFRRSDTWDTIAHEFDHTMKIRHALFTEHEEDTARFRNAKEKIQECKIVSSNQFNAFIKTANGIVDSAAGRLSVSQQLSHQDKPKITTQEPEKKPRNT